MNETPLWIHGRTLGERLFLARRDSGLSTRDVAKKAGVSAATVSRLESKKNNAEMWNLVHVARALDLPLTELFAGLEAGRPAAAKQAAAGEATETEGEEK